MIDGEGGFVAFAQERPRDPARAAGFGGHGGLGAFVDREAFGRDAELVPWLDHVADECLEGFLVVELELCPFGGPGDPGDADLVDVAFEIVIVVPPADPDAGGGGDVEGRGAAGRLGVELAVHVKSGHSLLVRVEHVGPFARRDLGLPVDVGVGEIGVDLDVGWAAELDDDLALRLFGSPSDDGGVGAERADPGLGGMRGGTGGEVRGLVAAGETVVAVESAGGTDDAGRGGRAGILGVGAGDFIAWRGAQMPDRGVTVRGVEDGSR